MLGQSNAFFTKTAFWLWVGNALYHSIVRTFPPIYLLAGDIYQFVQVAFGFSIILFWGDLKQSAGYDSGHWFWGTMLYLAVLLTVLGKAALVSECVHDYHAAAIHCSCSSHRSIWTKYTVAGNDRHS